MARRKAPSQTLHLVLDLETIPDPEAPPPKKEGAFPPPPSHQIVCAGYAWLADYQVTSWGVLDGLESDILTELTESIASMNPTIVGFNSRGFDLPVIASRCVRHGVPFPWYYQTKNPRYRYSTASHVDVMDQLCDMGAAPKASLDVWAKLIGLPGKQATTGGDVAEMMAAGRWPEVAAYCLEDVVQTVGLFLRSELVRGAFSLEWYQSTSTALLFQMRRDDRTVKLAAAIHEGRFCLLEDAPMPAVLEAAG